MLDLLELKTNDSFQSEVINEELSEFCLSKENLQRVERFEISFS